MRTKGVAALLVLYTIGIACGQDTRDENWRFNPVLCSDECASVGSADKCPRWVQEWAKESIRSVGATTTPSALREFYSDDQVDLALSAATCWYDRNDFLDCGTEACLFVFLLGDTLYVAILYPELLEPYYDSRRGVGELVPASPFSYSVQIRGSSGGIEWLGYPPHPVPSCWYEFHDNATPLPAEH